METSATEQISNPKEKSNPISSLFFLWTLPLFRKGFKKELTIEDIYTTLKKDKSDRLGDILERNFNKEIEKCIVKNKISLLKKEPSLAKALFKTFWRDLLYLGVLVVVNELFLKLANPICLGKLLEYFHPDSIMSKTEALWYAGGMILLNCVSVLCLNHYMVGCFHMGMRARIAVCSLIYRKSLRLSTTALGESAPGKVVNLLSNDVNRFDLVSVFLHYLWLGPVVAIASIYFLYENVGIAGVLSIIVVFTVMPIQSYAGKLSSRFRLQTAMKTDERVRLMGEIIYGVQVIKMYAWEKPFQIITDLARKLEIKVITKTSYVRAVYMSFLLITNRLAMFCTLIAMFFLGVPLESAKIFVVASYLNILSHTMSAMFVRAIAEIAEAIVALKRLQKYLMQEEFVKTKSTPDYLPELYVGLGQHHEKYSSNDDYVDKMNYINKLDKSALSICNAESKWLSDSINLTLQIEELHLERGKLVGVIGPIGCGKSSLLQLILGELPALSGNVEVNATVSYACQEPWVFGASIRQNILFGLPYEKNKYNEVVKVCALLRDFDQFPFGDLTIVGERGTSLSGGQKARINLARAVYREAEMYLLDDPLSAVDAHVGRHLFDECVVHYLRRKTRILVTHQLHYLKDADYIILLKDGKIEMQGTFKEVTNSSFDYARMLIPVKEEGSEDCSEVEENISNTRQRSYSRSRSRRLSRKNSIISQRTQRSGSLSSSIADIADFNADFVTTEAKPEEPEAKPQTIEAEKSSKGVIKTSIILGYLSSGANYFVLSISITLFFITQALASATDYWMSFWVSQEELRKFYEKKNAGTDLPYEEYKTATEKFSFDYTNDPLINNTLELSFNYSNYTIPKEEELLSSEMCMIIYGTLSGVLIVSAFIRSFSFYKICMRASKKLHYYMFRGIIRSPLRFFNVNPSGRIMNRFSKDMGSMDELLPKAIVDASQMILQMFGAIVLACVVNPIFIAPIIILAIIFMMVRKSYLKTSTNIKRLEGIYRSPVFTHLNATLNGLPTIRAYGAQQILKEEFDRYQDTHTSAWYVFIQTSSAFGLFLDVLCAILVTFVTFSFLLINSDILGDKVGLAISQTMMLTFMMQWGIRQSAEVSNQLMAVERILEYTQLPPEKGVAADETDIRTKSIIYEQQKKMKKPAQEWPEKGVINFKDLKLRYSEDPDDACVLKGLNCTFTSREKVGIVGRTGAGKSSIISALFRLAFNTGAIVIDEINTEDITLEELRKKISIIPQDPVLFSGTLRRNLDPFEEYSDSALWNALKEVELKDAITGPAGLESRVMDGGSNFSIGQRQLICLARAILRNNRVLLLDEATANVDPYTDGLIQRTIREKFIDCTVLTIAHRLNTIMDSDRVLVMDHGNIVEFDHPFVLLQNKNGFLYRMAEETGKQNSELLLEISKKNYNEVKFNGEKDSMKMIDD